MTSVPEPRELAQAFPTPGPLLGTAYRDLYLADLQAYVSQLKLLCNRMNITFEPLTTHTGFEKALLAYFHKRERLF